MARENEQWTIYRWFSYEKLWKPPFLGILHCHVWSPEGIPQSDTCSWFTTEQRPADLQTPQAADLTSWRHAYPQSRKFCPVLTSKPPALLVSPICSWQSGRCPELKTSNVNTISLTNRDVSWGCRETHYHLTRNDQEWNASHWQHELKLHGSKLKHVKTLLIPFHSQEKCPLVNCNGHL